MIRAAIDRGHWSNQVRRLSAAMGQSIEQVLTGQGKLFVRDAIKFTPPFGDAPIKESAKTQLEIGRQAVLADMRRMFKPAGWFDLFTVSRRAERLAKLAAEGREGHLLEAARRGGVRNLRGLVKEASDSFARQQVDRRGRYRRHGGFLVHDGTMPPYDWTVDNNREIPITKSVRELVIKRQANVGNAKAGWLKAAMGFKMRPDRALRKLPGFASGVFERRGSGTKLEFTIGNGVRYMQGRAELGIIRRAWGNRQRNIEKQIAAALRANAKKRGLKT